MKLTIFLRVKDKFSSYLKYRIPDGSQQGMMHVFDWRIEQCLNLAVR